MKKIIAVLSVLAVLMSLAACHNTKKMTDEEYSEYVAAEESKRVAESVKAEEMVSEGMNEVADDIGKTEKGKKVVLFRDTGVDKRYRVYYIGKDGKCESMVNYTFARDKESYNVLYDNAKNEGNIYKYDKDSRMVARKAESVPDADFQQLYDAFKNDKNWQIIE